MIRLYAGEMPTIVTEAERALVGNGNPFNVYQANGTLVRPVCDAAIGSNRRRTKAWRLVRNEVFPAIPDNPTFEDARRALVALWGPLAGFPFKGKADASVAVCALLTALDRHAVPTAPMFAFNAPTAGSGKSLLVDVASVIATGFPAAVISAGRDEQELEKRLGAELLLGRGIVSIDNLEWPLESQFLCQALTQQRVAVRVLGLSKTVQVNVGATFLCTGTRPRRKPTNEDPKFL